MQKFIFISLIFLLSSNELVAQEPFIVNTATQHQLPCVFALAENYFSFESTSAIVCARIVSDTVNWLIEKNSLSHYVISSKTMARSTTIELDAQLILSLSLENGESLELIAPIRAYADVKITPRSSVNIDEHSKTVTCKDVSFYASWDYPFYAKKRWRVYGIFDMSVYLNNERIRSFTGWYDSNDQTQMQNFDHFPTKAKLTVKVEQMKTLYQYMMNGKPQPIRLSENYPSTWEVRCDE